MSDPDDYRCTSDEPFQPYTPLPQAPTNVSGQILGLKDRNLPTNNHNINAGLMQCV